MSNHVWKVGDRFLYNGCCTKCNGKKGTVIKTTAYNTNSLIRVLIDNSLCNERYLDKGFPIGKSDMEYIELKGKQLEFSFME